jgi:D-3-phosphoglycerate dehydrogenase
MLKVLVTCPPMLRNIDNVRPLFAKHNIELHTPDVVQTLTVQELKALLPQYDGWIIGDDPANREVFQAGRAGRLKAAVKWGVGVDNVDFQAAKDLGIPIINTPGMFGTEVADVALGYVIALARETFLIDREVKAGRWAKPTGISLAGKRAAVIGFGDIGSNVAKRLLACDMRVTAYDPYFMPKPGLEEVENRPWHEGIDDADFLVVTCALTKENYHMVNTSVFAKMKRGIRVVNVARGPLIDEAALVEALRIGVVRSAALDVFEVEPLAADSPLRSFEQCLFGSHNGSNTIDAVQRTNLLAVNTLIKFLGVQE